MSTMPNMVCCIYPYTVQRKILTRENFDEFDELQVICQKFPRQSSRD